MADIIGTTLQEIIRGTGGDDIIYANGGGDTVTGGTGDDYINGGAGNDNLSGGSGDDKVYDFLGDDVLFGNGGSDALKGGDGNDLLFGGTGNDLLYGGIGDDFLSGGAGNDVYCFTLGAGQDTIMDYSSPTDYNSIFFGPGIKSDDLRFVRENGNLGIYVNGTADKLTILGYYEVNFMQQNGTFNMRFTDGTRWEAADIAAHALAGTAGNDTLVGSRSADTIYGYSGDDTINAYEGDDVVYGGQGNDTLYGNSGNDTLYGEGGNDKLYGGFGNDTYVFGVGAGLDTIYEYDTTSGNNDTVQLGADALNVILFKSGDNLNIHIGGTDDTLTINRYFTNSGYKVEQFSFAGGMTMTGMQVEQLVQDMAAFVSASGMTWSQIMQGDPAAEQDILTKFWAHHGTP